MVSDRDTWGEKDDHTDYEGERSKYSCVTILKILSIKFDCESESDFRTAKNMIFVKLSLLSL